MIEVHIAYVVATVPCMMWALLCIFKWLDGDKYHDLDKMSNEEFLDYFKYMRLERFTQEQVDRLLCWVSK